MDIRSYIESLRVPVIQAPMFGVSGPEMVIAACRAGVIGSFPAPNASSAEILGDWYVEINSATKGLDVPWAANLIVHPSHSRMEQDLEQVYRRQPPIVITALGSPRQVVEGVHAYGGCVLADVANVSQARKALKAGVDGLVLICSGAGGYTGNLSPFAFVEEVRRFFDGPLVLGGAINTGRAVMATRVMGADMAYVGTGFIATRESLAPQGHMDMVVECRADDIAVSDRVTGAAVSWLKPSLEAQGIDLDKIGEATEFKFSDSSAARPWKDLWAAGQGLCQTTAVGTVANVVDRLEQEYQDALRNELWVFSHSN